MDYPWRRKEAGQGLGVIQSDMAEERHRPRPVPQGCTSKRR